MEPLRVDVGIDKIRDYLLSNIDSTNPYEVEKVGRYLERIKDVRRMEKIVRKEGYTQVTVNGGQEFTKPHVLLDEINKANRTIIGIDKTLNFIDKKENKPKSLI